VGHVADPPPPAAVATLHEPAPGGPATGWWRAARVGVLGGLSLLLATGAHVLGGGSLPGAGVLLVAALVLGLLAAVVTVRRCRFALLAGLLGVQQLALHELFTVAGAARTCTLGASGPASAAHPGHVPGVARLITSCASEGGMQMTTGVPGWVMWAAHLGAVLVTAWVLARGEAWLWRAVDRVAAAAGLAVHRPGSPLAREPGSTAYVGVHRRRLAYAAAAPRGPPPLLAS
jgi:hypothetical protein